MKVTLKLYASLTSCLPPERRTSNFVVIEAPDGSTIAQIVEPFGLPPKSVHLVLVNGHFVPPEERASRALVENDVLAIWPPIAGG
jgi:sulfur carrier protein ThiS